MNCSFFQFFKSALPGDEWTIELTFVWIFHWQIQRLGNSLSQALAAAHNDLVRVVRESETNLDHQLSMLASDNGVFSCAISRLMERTSKLTASGSASVEEANSIQTAEAVTLESFATNGTRCVLKCP